MLALNGEHDLLLMHNVVKHSAVKLSAVKHSAVKLSAVKHSTVKLSAVKHSAVKQSHNSVYYTLTNVLLLTQLSILYSH